MPRGTVRGGRDPTKSKKPFASGGTQKKALLPRSHLKTSVKRFKKVLQQLQRSNVPSHRRVYDVLAGLHKRLQLVERIDAEIRKSSPDFSSSPAAYFRAPLERMYFLLHETRGSAAQKADAINIEVVSDSPNVTPYGEMRSSLDLTLTRITASHGNRRSISLIDRAERLLTDARVEDFYPDKNKYRKIVMSVIREGN